MKSLLVFPPGWNPASPYLALPIIKSYLKENSNMDVDIKDTNVEFFDYIFTKSYLNKCLQRVNNNMLICKKHNNTINMFKDSIEEIEFAKNTMRTYEYLKPHIRKHVDTM